MMPAGPGARPRGATSCSWKSRTDRCGTGSRSPKAPQPVDAPLLPRGPPPSYAVQAAIAALHARAPNFRDTDWPQIAGLYEVLLRISPSPVVELNHAAAVSMVDGPARALDLIDAIEARGALDRYELLPAVPGRPLRPRR